MTIRIFWAMMLFAVAISCKKTDPDPVPVSTEVKLGAPLDLSGIYSETGRACQAAIDLAVEDINQFYTMAGSKVRFSVRYEDTMLDTSIAKQATINLMNQGITLLVGGPSTSSELKAIKPIVDANRLLDLNASATAPSLAVAGDNIFRVITDDNVQGQAVVRMMQHDGLEALIPVWRNDTYGTGLYETVKELFTGEGGNVLQGISYSGDGTNFEEVMGKLAVQVNQALAQYGQGKVGVYLVSYQDISDFFIAASPVAVLSTVPWYGCDGNTRKSTVTGDPVAAQFALDVRFVAPVMAIGTASYTPAKVREIAQRVKERIGYEPDDMALSAYDAVMIYSRCYDLVGRYDAMAIKSVLPVVCDFYDYMGIHRRMNAAGDLASANYVFWTMEGTPGNWSWDSYATWLTIDNSIIIKQ